MKLTGGRKRQNGTSRLREATFVGLAAISASIIFLGCGAGATTASSQSTTGGSKSATGTTGGSKSPIVVGYPVTLTGSTAVAGKDEENGFNLGLKESGDVVNGHPIKVNYVNTNGPTTAKGLSDARLLITSDHVNVMEGPIFSNVVDVISPYVLPRGIPIDTLTLTTPQQISVFKKYGMGYVSGWSLYQASTPGAAFAYNTRHWRHVTLIANDFGYGWMSAGGFGAEFTKLGGKIDKAIWVPANATTMASYISQIPNTTQAVWVELPGGQAVNFVNEYKSYGIKTKIPLMGNTTLLTQVELPAIKKTAGVGLYMSTQYCTGAPSTANQKFANAYHNAYGLWPAYYSEAGYVKAEILVAALKKVNGNVTVNNKASEKALGKAMLNVDITAPRGPVKLTTTAHSVIENGYICKVQTVNGTLRDVPVKTYKNLPPSGLLSTSEWKTAFAQQSKGRPSF